MLNIPVVLFPVLAFVLAVIVGRLVTIVLDHFRDNEIATATNRSKATIKPRITV